MSSEMDKLELYLKENRFGYERITEEKPFFGTFDQIRCGEWDAVCHNGSYGGNQGLLETYGMPEDNGDVSGWLTADDIIKRLEEGDKTKVYIVLIHKAGENPWIHSVYAHAEDANNKANELTEEFRNGEWADFISEEVR